MTHRFQLSDVERARAQAVLRELDRLEGLYVTVLGRTNWLGALHAVAGPRRIDARVRQSDPNPVGMATKDAPEGNAEVLEFPSAEAESYQRPRRLRRNSGWRRIDAPLVTPEYPSSTDCYPGAGLEPSPAPSHGRSVLICSPFRDDRFLLSEYALALGWSVTLRSDAEKALESLGPAVVLIVVRPCNATAGAQILSSLRRARYARDVTYLAASPSRC